jgi:hypothetical protein
MTYKKRVLQEFFPNAKLQRISSMQFNIILPNPPSALEHEAFELAAIINREMERFS